MASNLKLPKHRLSRRRSCDWLEYFRLQLGVALAQFGSLSCYLFSRLTLSLLTGRLCLCAHWRSNLLTQV